MSNPQLNGLLKWGIENSAASRNDPSAPKTPDTKFDPSAFQEVLNIPSIHSMPSDATRMKEDMEIIKNTDLPLENRKTAFEDFETLVQSLDNANDMENQSLWTDLVAQLQREEAVLRMHAAWCVGTAVENHRRSQERLLVLGAIPTLVKLATEDGDVMVRKKAVRALSAASRNFQPGLDAVVDHVPSQFKPEGKLDAGDMSSVDSLIVPLRTNAKQPR